MQPCCVCAVAQFAASRGCPSRLAPAHGSRPRLRHSERDPHSGCSRDSLSTWPQSAGRPSFGPPMKPARAWVPAAREIGFLVFPVCRRAICHRSGLIRTGAGFASVAGRHWRRTSDRTPSRRVIFISLSLQRYAVGAVCTNGDDGGGGGKYRPLVQQTLPPFSGVRRDTSGVCAAWFAIDPFR